MPDTSTQSHKRTVKFVRSGYQPMKAELETPVKLNLPDSTTLEQMVNDLLQPVKIKWMNKPKHASDFPSGFGSLVYNLL